MTCIPIDMHFERCLSHSCAAEKSCFSNYFQGAGPRWVVQYKLTLQSANTALYSGRIKAEYTVLLTDCNVHLYFSDVTLYRLAHGYKRSTDGTALIFNVQQPRSVTSLDRLCLNSALQSFEMLVTTDQSTQRNIPECSNLQHSVHLHHSSSMSTLRCSHAFGFKFYTYKLSCAVTLIALCDVYCDTTTGRLPLILHTFIQQSFRVNVLGKLPSSFP